MISRIWFALPVAVALILVAVPAPEAPACCPAPPSGKPVVNADQSVIILWDAATKTQHFIRRASFKSEADDFGFLVPSPSQPELSESGNEAFPFLQKLTEPEIRKVPRPAGGVRCGCNSTKSDLSLGEAGKDHSVKILEEKTVAGFKATVLEATSTTALVKWLRENGYAFSPEVEAWAKPYVEGPKPWAITALKVARGKDAPEKSTVSASALRMSFKTDRPLFPYREPASQKAAEHLKARQRLLRIYFLADARYEGELTKEIGWTGQVAWANKLTAEQRQRTLEMLKLPQTTGPAEWWLTEFEDNWPYRIAPADLCFSRSPSQDTMKRPPIIDYVAAPGPGDVMACALALVIILPPLARRAGHRRTSPGSMRMDERSCD